MAKKKLMDDKRGNLLQLDPSKIRLIGRDTEHRSMAEHPLYTPRVHREPNERRVATIKAVGVVQPIKVRRDGDFYDCVFGRGRVIDAREANRQLAEEGRPLVMVPCTVARGTDIHMARLMVVENFGREDETPLQSAHQVQGYLDLLGSTGVVGKDMLEDAAAYFHRDVKTIRQWLALLDLDDSIQKAVENGEVTAAAVAPLAKLAREEQVAKFQEIKQTAQVNGGRITNRQTTQTVADATGEETKVAPSKRAVQALLKLPKAVLEESEIDPAFWRGVKWAIGEVKTGSIRGLTELLEEGKKRAKERRAKAKAKDADKQDTAP